MRPDKMTIDIEVDSKQALKDIKRIKRAVNPYKSRRWVLPLLWLIITLQWLFTVLQNLMEVMANGFEEICIHLKEYINPDEEKRSRAETD